MIKQQPPRVHRPGAPPPVVIVHEIDEATCRRLAREYASSVGPTTADTVWEQITGEPVSLDRGGAT